MNRFTLIAFLLLVLASGAPGAVSAQQTEAPLTCDRGPITRTLGGNEWLVYSCSDCCSVVFLSAEESPAFPFYFILTPENGTYSLYGEGTGNKDATKAAHDDILMLDSQEIISLIEETRQTP